jgi:hypothetical protein
MQKTPPDGPEFSLVLKKLLERETNWKSWQKANCPAFEKFPSKQPQQSASISISSESKEAEGGVKTSTNCRVLYCPELELACLIKYSLYLVQDLRVVSTVFIFICLFVFILSDLFLHLFPPRKTPLIRYDENE